MDGRISAEKLRAYYTPQTFLISVMHSNNETGIINNIKEITSDAYKNNIYVHTDSVQSIGKTYLFFIKYYYEDKKFMN